MKHVDVIVVGLGAAGSATAYQLARRGCSTIGIDQFRPPHGLGSSHGDSRVTRQSISEGESYVPLALRSHELWREIERDTGAEILTQCGVLMVAPGNATGSLHGNADWFQQTVTLAERYEIAHELLSGRDARERFPLFNFDDECRAYFEPGGGFVRPENAIRAQLQLAAQYGATLQYDERVTRITHTGSSVQVATDSGTYQADHVILSAGAWIHDFLQASQLRSRFSVYRQALHWFDVAPPHAHLTTPDTCPVYMWAFGPSPDDFFYGFPAIDGADGGMKIATEQFSVSTSVASVDRSVHPGEAQLTYDHCLRNRHNGITSTALRSAACLYTATHDSHFIVDEHPELCGVHLVSPCSGHGFKHSAALGEAVAQKIMDGESTIDLSSFSLI